MALQDILKKIIEEAQEEIQVIESKNREKIKELQKESEAQEKKDLLVIDDKTQKALESVEKKTLSMAHREGSRMRLEMKHEVLRDLVELFIEKLEKADEKSYGEVIQKLFGTLNAPSGKIYAPPQRIEITTQKAPQGFDVVAHKDIHGGFIAQINDITIDNTFRTLILQEFSEDITLFLTDELKLVD